MANLGRNYCAAYHSLKVIGNVGPSDLVLVTGSTGGVGMATVELAKAMGCKVISRRERRIEKGLIARHGGCGRRT